MGANIATRLEIHEMIVYEIACRSECNILLYNFKRVNRFNYN